MVLKLLKIMYIKTSPILFSKSILIIKLLHFINYSNIMLASFLPNKLLMLNLGHKKVHLLINPNKRKKYVLQLKINKRLPIEGQWQEVEGQVITQWIEAEVNKIWNNQLTNQTHQKIQDKVKVNQKRNNT